MGQKSEIYERLALVERKSAVCTISGGLDSAVAAAVMADAGFTLNFIFFNWKQKTYVKELECAGALAKYYRADLMEVAIPLLGSLVGVSLTQEETLTTAVNEYVPNRNAIFESMAVAYAENLRAGAVCIGSTGGDHICPDNSQEFVDAMQVLVNQGTLLKPPVQLIAPLMQTDKIGAVKVGLALGVPFELTWSCHNGTKIACGQCSNCLARLEAFKLNNSVDPIKYRESND